MPFKWDAAADSKLFYCVMIRKNLTFGNEDYAALAEMMGDDVVPGAVRNRLSGLKTKLNKEGVAKVTASEHKGAAADSAPKKTKAARQAGPKNGGGKRADTTQQPDEDSVSHPNEVGKRVKETRAPVKKRKAASDVSVEEDLDDLSDIKWERRDDSLELGSAHGLGELIGSSRKGLKTGPKVAGVMRAEEGADEGEAPLFA